MLGQLVDKNRRQSTSDLRVNKGQENSVGIPKQFCGITRWLISTAIKKVAGWRQNSLINPNLH